MNRNHQSQNTQNHIARGRENLARKQMGNGMRMPMSENPREIDRETITFDTSNFNRPAKFNRNEIPYQDWISSTEEKNYDNYRSDGPGPVEIEAREKYKHDNVYSHYIDHHGRVFSIRAKKEMNNENDQNFINSYAGVGPKSYIRSDESIQDEIHIMLTENEVVDASNISVDVHDGIVKLYGFVTGRYSKFYVEDLVENVSGIKDIQNDIRVSK